MRSSSSIISENKKRLDYIDGVYNQKTGEGCDSVPRVKIQVKDYPIPVQYIPVDMYEREPICKELAKCG